MPPDLDAAPWADLLGSADQLHVAVAGKGGPLVTPELFTVAGGRMWCLTARTTAKAKILDDGDRVGVAARSDLGWVTAGATVRCFDPLDPHTLLGKAGDVPGAGAGLLRFLAANGYEMAGAATAAIAGRLGAPPPARVLLELEPVWGITSTDDGEVIVVGEVSNGASGHGRGAACDVPPEIDAPELDDGAVMIGWEVPWGPAALPARWDADRAAALVPRALLDALGAPATSRTAVCADSWSAPGPLGKQGSMHRGRGWITDAGEEAALVVDVERVVEWDGVEVTATDV